MQWQQQGKSNTYVLIVLLNLSLHYRKKNTVITITRFQCEGQCEMNGRGKQCTKTHTDKTQALREAIHDGDRMTRLNTQSHTPGLPHPNERPTAVFLYQKTLPAYCIIIASWAGGHQGFMRH